MSIRLTSVIHYRIIRLATRLASTPKRNQARSSVTPGDQAEIPDVGEACTSPERTFKMNNYI